ncbi:peptidase inhibitor I9 [Ilumatobacter fluminis]|uniref:Peptidase inhibitor I9 n=1 Tax=Ilumatobacter fluminis TaxID=467091 RepID=A0A4R7HYN4_9ACTN|nr:S8 family serine peptidase [Ilumatobacter fluminis]TDT15263.1 peptidase inhibitor I9 [Ilumatobacter fluminis]
MRRRLPAALVAGALAVTTVAAFGSAGGVNAEPPDTIDVSQLTDGEVIPGRYVVIMDEDPLVAQFGQDQLDSKAAKKAQNGLKKGHQKALAAAGADASQVTAEYTVALNGFAAELSDVELAKMKSVDGVTAVIPDVWRTAQTDNSGDFLGLTSPGGLYAKGYDGEGVVIGVIDSGIWPEHASFADDGSYADLGITLDETVYPACDFGNTAHNANDAPFECNNKLIGARQTIPTYRSLIGAEPFEFDSARDDDGHGTHTASTAAGNAGVSASILGVDRGVVTGVAPRARIIAYKGLGTLGGFGSDLAASIDQAVADGVDVINYSIGSSSFAIGPDDVAFLFAADAGVFVATSNGNSGPNPATTGSPASVPWLTSVGASTQDRTFQGSASSSDGWEFFGASVTAGTDELPLVDAEDAGDNLCNPGALDPAVVAGKIVLCERGAIARVAKSEAVAIAGGAGMILFNQTDTQELVTDTHFVPSVHINNTNGLIIKGYIDSAGAGAVAQINGGALTPSQGSVMAAFSSRGPNSLAPDIVKPDVTAPGVNILAGNTPFPAPGAVSGELFQSISGTSMSSPHVAGLFALIKQANPDWTPAVAKSALMTTSRQDVTKEDAATPADPFDMGAGHVDPSTSGKGSIFEPGLAYDAGLLEYAAFTCGAELGVFTPGTCAYTDSLGIPSDPAQLNLPSIGIDSIPASETVTRTVTSVAKDNGWRTYNVSVDAPAGFEVTVNPSSFRIKPGQSVSYDVTVTNVSAPAGEWRHGSLTWSDTTGHYQVYSPISVNGALLAAPDAVAGAGEAGSTSFDVTFGYTGAYSAAPHGLAPEVLLSGSVGQDPDQTYPSLDDADPGVVEIPFPIAGAAFARLELVIPGDDDIDLFLEDSSGNAVGSSTNGGTDELIELTLPADDTYTLIVHGWSVPNEPLPFDVSTWVVPLASGGSLAIDSAPTAATIGATETIDVSWTGAAAGERSLGAVSHADGSGLIGLTLVEVDNR